MRRPKGRHSVELAEPDPSDRPDANGRAQAPADLSIERNGSRLGERLVAKGAVSEDEVKAVLALMTTNRSERLGRQLIARGALEEGALALALAEQYHLPTVNLGEITPTDEATALVTEATARELAALPLSLQGDSVRVAIADPTEDSQRRIQLAIGRTVIACVAPLPDVLSAIGTAYRALTNVDSQIQEFEVRDRLRRDAARLETVSVNDEAPVVQVVQLIIAQGLRDRASDIHIEPSADRIRVRYRVDGALHDVVNLPGSIGPAIVSRIKIMAGLNIVERRRPQDGQISLDIEERDVDIRVSTTSVVGGEKVVMRLLDKSRPLYALSQLGMPDDVAERYRALLRSPYGMVICAGPTGSGKTTTLYGSLGELNSTERNIMTIEDPVEYTFPTINQIQINEQAGITFANGLRSILRQDPDIILVGEVRDVDTARIAVQSALTGHFVLSSLHATDTIAALYRLLDMGIESFLVASAVSAVVAQRLVRRICTHCRQPYEPSPDELAFLELFGGRAPDRGFSSGVGCNFCAQTGYLDRIGVYELMPITDEVREMIIDRRSHDEVRKVCRNQGMRTLQEESLRLVQAGVTTLGEVIRTIYVGGV
jgi:type IV pilus assembly protein PilB